MRFKIWIYLLFVHALGGILMTSSFAQTQSSTLQSVMDIVDPNGLNQELTFANKYSDMQGDPFMLKIWGVGSVTTNQGKQIPNVNINVDLYANEVIVKLDQKEFILSTESFESAAIRTENGREIQLDLYQLPQQIEPKFVEVLYEGKSKLIKWEEVQIRKMENNAGGYSGSSNTSKEVQKLFRSIHYYLQKPDEETLIEVSSNKKDLLDIMADHADPIKRYIKKEKLKLKQEEDLVQLVQHYDKIY